jgi:hypothetical protein
METFEGEVSGLRAKHGGLQENHEKLEIKYMELVYEREMTRIVKNDPSEASGCRRNSGDQVSRKTEEEGEF